jgi:hypothetical protein
MSGGVVQTKNFMWGLETNNSKANLYFTRGLMGMAACSDSFMPYHTKLNY